MRLKMKRLRGFVCVSLILALLALPGMAFAEERGCTVTIPTYVEVTGTSSLTDAEFEVVLVGLDTEEPMPEKSSGTVKGSGQVDLGPMTYTVPGDYHYRISQKVGNAEGYTYDTAVYTVTVRVVNGKDDGLNAEVWAVKDGGSDKVEEILFSNAYKAPEDPKKPEEPNKPAAPQTGEQTHMRLFAALLGLSVLVMILSGFRQSRKDRRFD